MAQAEAICGSSILACGLRVTLLNDNGSVASTSNNFYVTDNLVEIAATPVVAAGSDRELRSGCDCIIATAKFPDLLKRFTFEIQLGALEPGLESLMLGAPVILDTSDVPVAIGLDWPTQVSCSDDRPPKVAIEVWSYNWDTDAQNATLPYIHWVWPMTQWQIAPTRLNTDFAAMVMTGFSTGNSLWGHGPYNDDPGQVIGHLGSLWQTATVPPASDCGYQTVSATS
jgi:hypothetical protein